MKNITTPAISKEVLHPSLHLSIIVNGHHPSHKVLLYCVIFTKVLLYNCYIYKNTYSAGMKERCRDGCRTSLLIAGVVLVPAIFHTLIPPCHPYITIHFIIKFRSIIINDGQIKTPCSSSRHGEVEHKWIGCNVAVFKQNIFS